MKNFNARTYRPRLIPAWFLPVLLCCLYRAGYGATLNVKDYGAAGNGGPDDTAAIQSAIAAAAAGDTVMVPDGVYMINALTAIQLKSDITLKLSAGATLKAIPNSSGSYTIVMISGDSNVSVLGGVIEGERAAHTGAGGEWGMGIHITGSHNVLVDGVTVKECWGDGIYVTGASTDITIDNVTADHNRRQGLSVINVNGMVVRNSVFKNTDGTSPKSGIDIEPNLGDFINNVLITGCTAQNNVGNGFVAYTSTGPVTNIVLNGNRSFGNGQGGIGIYNSRFSQTTNNIIGVKILNNIVENNTTHGIYEYDVLSSTITGNLVTGNGGYGIAALVSTGANITANTVWLNHNASAWDTPMPTGAFGTAPGAGAIAWKWNGVAGASGFRVVSLSGANVSGDLPAAALSWVEPGLSPYTSYSRKVVAFNAVGVSTSAVITAYTLPLTAASSAVKIFPNPMRAALGHTAVTFSNIPPGASVRIFTVLGELITELTADAAGMVNWNAKNKNGGKTASGVYLAVIKTASGGTTTRKLVVER